MERIKEELVISENEKREKLWGVLTLPVRPRQVPAIIICHGFSGSKSKRNFVELGRELAKKGFASFRFDFSGHGDSEGKIEDLSIEKQVRELNFAYKKLIRDKKIDKERIGILGHSLGALIAVLFQQKYQKAKTLILVAPALDQRKLVLEWHSSKEIKQWKQKRYLDTDKGRIGIKYLQESEKDYLKFVPKITIPTLIIHGENDKDVPIKYSQELLKKLGTQKKKLMAIEDVKHDFQSKKGISSLISLSKKWLKENL